MTTCASRQNLGTNALPSDVTGEEIERRLYFGQEGVDPSVLPSDVTGPATAKLHRLREQQTQRLISLSHPTPPPGPPNQISR